jgi:hypothetical protein
MKRQAMNNFLDEKLAIGSDLVKEEELKIKKESEDLEQTIILGKKGEVQDDAKKYVEATRKTCVISRSENIHQRSNDQ